MSLGKVSIAIEAQMASFESDMGRAARVAEKNLRKIEKDAKQTEEQMKRIGKAIGLALVAGATAATVALKGAINAMDDMSKAAQKANMPTEDFSRLAYAGKLADVSMQDLQGSLGKLAKAQGDSLKATSEQGRVFEALGISVKNADGTLRATGEVFKDFADRFQEMKGSPEIVAAGMAIFGRSFQNLIPLLKDGREGLEAAANEADRLGVTLSTKAGQEAEAFNDNLTRLQTAASGLAMSVANELMPDLLALSERFVGAVSDGDRLENTANSIGDAFRVLGEGIEFFVITPLNVLGDVVEGMTRGFVGLTTAAQGLLSLNWDKMRRGYAEAQGGADQAYYGTGPAPKASGPRVLMSGRDKMPESMMRAANDDAPDMAALRLALGGGPAKTKKAGGASKKSDAEREAESLQRAYDSLMESQKERIALFGQETEVSKVTYDTQFGGLSKLSEAQKLAAIANAEKLDTMKADAEELKKAIELEDKATKAADDHAKQVKDFIKDQEFQLSIMGLSNIEREKEIALRYANVDAMSAEGKKIVENIEAMDKAAENAAFIEDFKTGLADAFVDFASGAKSAKDAFGDFADYLYKRALQVMADKAIQAMFDAFDEDKKGSGGGSGSGEGFDWGGMISGMFSSGDSGGGSSGGGGEGFDWAGLIGSFFGGGKAAGGPVSGSKFYEVGENNRPEILRSRGKSYLIPGNDGNVTPIRGGGKGVTQHFTQVVQGAMTRRTAEQAARSNGREAARGMARTGR